MIFNSIAHNAGALTHCKYTTFINTTNIYAIFFLLICINFDSII